MDEIQTLIGAAQQFIDTMQQVVSKVQETQHSSSTDTSTAETSSSSRWAQTGWRSRAPRRRTKTVITWWRFRSPSCTKTATCQQPPPTCPEVRDAERDRLRDRDCDRDHERDRNRLRDRDRDRDHERDRLRDRDRDRDHERDRLRDRDRDRDHERDRNRLRDRDRDHERDRNRLRDRDCICDHGWRQSQSMLTSLVK